MNVSTGLIIAMLLAVLSASNVNAEATFVINNVDDPGQGFNDGTPATPVGGNPGTSLGEQRLIVVQYALDTWGARLNSGPTIVVRTSNQSLGCEPTSGTLAQAGSLVVHADFPGAPRASTIYPAVLANALSGFDINARAEGLPAGQPDALTSASDRPSDVNDEIEITINADIGNSDCLGGSPYYLGLDNQPPTGSIDLLDIIMHEAAHGLGFQDFFNQETGRPVFGDYDIFSEFIFDNVSELALRDQIDDAARIEALNNPGQLVWTGPNVTANAALLLQQQLVLTFNAQSGPNESLFGTAGFGPAAGPNNFNGNVVLAIDDAGVSPNDACETLINAAAIDGNVALIDRGECFFVDKVQIAQDAGATAVIIANNEAGIVGMSGQSTTITIPTISISNSDADAIKGDLANGVSVTLVLDSRRLQGADNQGRVKLYSPDPPEPGSSIAHFDFSAFPDLLMEPSASSQTRGATQVDLTDDLLADLGWSVVSNPSLPLAFPQSNNNGGGTDTGGNDGDTDTGGDNGGGTDTGDNGGDTDTGGDNGGGTDTGDNGGDTDTGGDSGGGTDTGGNGGDTDTGGDSGGDTDTGGDNTPEPPASPRGGGGGFLNNALILFLLTGLLCRKRRDNAAQAHRIP